MKKLDCYDLTNNHLVVLKICFWKKEKGKTQLFCYKTYQFIKVASLFCKMYVPNISETPPSNINMYLLCLTMMYICVKYFKHLMNLSFELQAADLLLSEVSIVNL